MARHSRKVIVYNREMQVVDEFKSSEDAAKALGICPVSARNMCRRGNKSRYPLEKYGGRYYLGYGKQETQYTAEVDIIQSKRFIAAHNRIGERECLLCGVAFQSNGPWNRRCRTCLGKEQFGEVHIDRKHKVTTGRYHYME